MKERKIIKRFGAAFTAFAVVSSLGSLAVFADEDASSDISIEVSEDDVTSVEDASQADIKKVLPVEEETDETAQTAEATNIQIDQEGIKGSVINKNIFKIVVPYTGVAEGAQTTWMAYKADKPDTPLGDLKIEYVNQDTTASSVTFYVKSEAAELTEENILNEPDVLIKIGGTNAVAQAAIVKVSEFDIVDVMFGDLNGDTVVSIADVGMAFDISNGTEATDEQIEAADVNGDSVVSIMDVGMIFDRSNGDDTPFPVE